MTIEKLMKMNIGNKSERGFILRRLDEQYNDFIELLSLKFPSGSIGKKYVQFGRLYFDIAVDVFYRYREEFPPQVFNEYWNERLKGEKRIFVNQKVAVNIDIRDLMADSEFEDSPFLELCDNVSIVFESCNIDVFWNNNAEINEEFAKAYLKEYFEKEILTGYAKGLEEYNRKGTDGKPYTYKIYVTENEKYINSKFRTLENFFEIKPETILQFFSEIVSEYNMSVMPDEYGVCGDITVLEFVFGRKDDSNS